MWVTSATSVMAMDVSLHLGGRRSLHNTYEHIRHVSVVGREAMAWVMSGWVRGDALTDGSKVRKAVGRVQDLAFGTNAQRGSPHTVPR